MNTNKILLKEEDKEASKHRDIFYQNTKLTLEQKHKTQVEYLNIKRTCGYR